MQFSNVTHSIQLAAIPVNKEAKDQLIKAILQIKGDSFNILKEMIDFQENVIHKSREIMDEMHDMIKACDDSLYEILMCKDIYRKHFYTQLEAILLGFDEEEIVKKISSPRIQMPNINFQLNFSSFPGILSQYNHVSSIHDGRLNYYTNKIESFTDEKINNVARMLYVNRDTILITGGTDSKQTLLVNIASLTIQNAPDLNEKRYAHAMGWINGFPAVVSGQGSSGLLNSVELLIGNKWIKSENINIPRKRFSCCTTKNKVLLLGGINSDDEGEVVIEAWDSKNWFILEVFLSCRTYWLGTCAVGSKIYLFGGKLCENDVISESISSINYSLSIINKEEDMSGGHNFDINLWQMCNDKICSLDIKGELFIYPLIKDYY